MIEVTVVNQQDDVSIDEEAVRQFVQILADETGTPADEVSVAFLGDHEMKILNLKYRGFDRVTDVLSFPLEEDKTPEGKYNLGDLILCATRAETQAGDAGHDTWTEIRILLIHGFLHLLGLEHPEGAITDPDDDGGPVPMEQAESRLRIKLLEGWHDETGATGE